MKHYAHGNELCIIRKETFSAFISYFGGQNRLRENEDTCNGELGGLPAWSSRLIPDDFWHRAQVRCYFLAHEARIYVVREISVRTRYMKENSYSILTIIFGKSIHLRHRNFFSEFLLLMTKFWHRLFKIFTIQLSSGWKMCETLPFYRI